MKAGEVGFGEVRVGGVFAIDEECAAGGGEEDIAAGEIAMNPMARRRSCAECVVQGGECGVAEKRAAGGIPAGKCEKLLRPCGPFVEASGVGRRCCERGARVGEFGEGARVVGGKFPGGEEGVERAALEECFGDDIERTDVSMEDQLRSEAGKPGVEG